MDPAAEYNKLITSAPDSDIVKFTFKKQQGKVVRCLKSVLIKKSPVFAAMFNETWNGDTVELDDQVTFIENEVFVVFIWFLIGSNNLNGVTVFGSCGLYFYAEKYQIADLKSKLITLKAVTSITLPQLTSVLRVVNESNLIEMKVALDNKIKLDLNADNALDFYKTCIKMDMKNLTAQVEDYITTMKYDSKWPPELLLRIAEKNRKELQQIKQVLNNERQVTTGCIILCGKRSRNNDCEKCHSMWAKIKKVG